MGLRKIWKNKKSIFNGLKNFFFKNPYVEAIATERLAVCKSCPSYDDKGTKCEVPGTKPCCGECGCSLKLKVRSIDEDNECPLNKWKKL